MAENNHGFCPRCNADFDGGSIWETGYDMALRGEHYNQNGVPADHLEAQQEADRYAEAYGATRTSGRWGRQIGIYSMEKDRTVAWQCPDCKYEWSRG